MKRLPDRHRQRGITLVELMIAGLLGLLISYFAMTIMMTSNRTAARADGQSQAQETGRFVMTWLATEVRRAGYVSAVGTSSRINPIAALCDVANNAPPDENGDCTFNSDNADSDRIAIRRIYSSTSANNRDALDCTGVDLSVAAGLVSDSSVLVDVYWVERDSGNGGDAYDDILRCATYNEETGMTVAPSQVLASGIEGMQALYAESPTINGQDVNRFVSADQITSLSAVMAVRIAILTRSFGDDAANSGQRSYVLLDAAPYTFDDRISRQILTTTIALKQY